MMSVRFFSVVLIVLAASFGLGAAGPAGAAPRFEDFPAGQTYTGPVHAPDLSSHPDAQTYRTQLQNAAKGGVNFAGDHILATWGCGGQCLMGAVINARSGHVQFLPGTVCCWLEAGEDINPIEFEADSDLLVLTGLVNEEEPMARRYYNFRSREFLLIETRAQGASAPGANTGGGAQPAALFDICYYDSRGAQHDADWCTAGGDISIAKNVNLSPHCRANAGAVCQLGNSGPCRPGSKTIQQLCHFPVSVGPMPGDPQCGHRRGRGARLSRRLVLPATSFRAGVRARCGARAELSGRFHLHQWAVRTRHGGGTSTRRPLCIGMRQRV